MHISIEADIWFVTDDSGYTFQCYTFYDYISDRCEIILLGQLPGTAIDSFEDKISVMYCATVPFKRASKISAK